MQTASTDQTRTTDEPNPRCDELVEELRLKVENGTPDWQRSFISVVAAWPVGDECVDGERYHYFIGGEALNWKRLAERIAAHLASSGLSIRAADEVFEWIDTSGVFGGIGEQLFRRTVGVDAWRAHLNYFYGVHVEQCLIVAFEERMFKQRYSTGKQPNDESCEVAYVGLYEETEETLWEEFTLAKSAELSELFDELDTDTRSMALDDEFTYWLFKRRIEHTNAPQVGAETVRGLRVLSDMREADVRRQRLLKENGQDALLEFGLVNANGRG